jgi:hypothetical protein
LIYKKEIQSSQMLPFLSIFVHLPFVVFILKVNKNPVL